MHKRINTNPVDIAFHIWITNYPESFHHYDVNRFYVYVFTALHYKEGHNYLCKDYFIKKCKSYGFSNQKDIDSYWLRQSHVMEIDKCSGPILFKKSSTIDEQSETTFDQAIIIDNKMLIVNITKEEYLKGGLSKAKLLERLSREKR